MALSKSRRIMILLAVDCVFFLIELITGYAVDSLALVADAFHMLNDVLSLCVGLWAVKVANQRGSSKTYTYGWQRAETLGALINGVFLVALCVAIFLDAIQRFAKYEEVKNPMLVMIVGCFGLASNLLGLVLFHDHTHSHGPGGHSHGGGEEIGAAEEGHAHSHEDHTGHSHAAYHSEDSEITIVESGSPLAAKTSSTSRQSRQQRRHSRSQSRAFMSNLDDIPSSPNAIRNSIIQRSRMEPVQSDEDADGEGVMDEGDFDTHVHADVPLLNSNQGGSYGAIQKHKSIDHTAHNHAQPKQSGKGGHSHSDLNMRGIFLHVMGDALGNIGVIGSGLFIWLTHFWWRSYVDPAVSLVITCIILASAIPLCKAASKILLQAVPDGIDIDHIQEDIEDLPGIISAHHLHVWQLSDTKKVASLHVQVSFDFKGEGSARYMELAQAIRKCLQAYGIHSSTIQPEFCLDPEHDHSNQDASDGTDDGSPGSVTKRSKPGSGGQSKAGSVREPKACLMECGDCGGDQGCCGPAGGAKDAHDHGH